MTDRSGDDTDHRDTHTPTPPGTDARRHALALPGGRDPVAGRVGDAGDGELSVEIVGTELPDQCSG